MKQIHHAQQLKFGQILSHDRKITERIKSLASKRNISITTTMLETVENLQFLLVLVFLYAVRLNILTVQHLQQSCSRGGMVLQLPHLQLQLLHVLLSQDCRGQAHEEIQLASKNSGCVVP